MRKSAFMLLIACVSMMLWTTGCTDKKKPEAADTTSIDTLVADTMVVDSMEELLTETPVSKAVDELFDDFIFNFAGNRKMQLNRIAFPLKVSEDGKVHTVTRKQWKMERFFMTQGFYTQILDNRKQLNLSKDTSVSHVVVEKIFLNKQTVCRYNFNRQNGEWKLTSIDSTPLAENQNASFLEFYQRFATDSAFQMKSLNDPIAFTGPDPDDDFNTLKGDLLPEQWPDVGPTDLPSDEIYNIIYGQKYTSSGHKVFLLRGIANGQELEMEFCKTDEGWKLTKLSE